MPPLKVCFMSILFSSRLNDNQTAINICLSMLYKSRVFSALTRKRRCALHLNFFFFLFIMLCAALRTKMIILTREVTNRTRIAMLVQPFNLANMLNQYSNNLLVKHKNIDKVSTHITDNAFHFI